jgi:hypothetical protein
MPGRRPVLSWAQERRYRSGAPTQPAHWASLLRSQAEGIVACDFFTADLLDGAQVCVLAVIEHATRRIRILGRTLHPSGEWTAQMPATCSWTSTTRRPR